MRLESYTCYFLYFCSGLCTFEMGRGNIKEVSLLMSIIVLTTHILNVMAMEVTCPSCNQIFPVEIGWDRGLGELNRVQGKWFELNKHDPQPEKHEESSAAPTHLMRNSHSEPSINEAYNFHTGFQKTEHKDGESNKINSASATPNKIVQVTNIWCGSESLNTRRNWVMPLEHNEGRLKQLHLKVNQGDIYLDLLLHACTNDQEAYLRGAMGVFNTFQVVKHEGEEQRGEGKISIDFTFEILVNST